MTDFFSSFIPYLANIIHSVLHLDQTLAFWLQTYGSGVYFVLFIIIFCETGLVVMPFLPGDSLLFTAGALSAISNEQLKVELIIPLLILGSIFGDSVNYYAGSKWGRKAFETKHRFSFLFSKKHLYSTEHFYKKKGRWAVALARFFPIIRTFAPFVAGITLMPYKQFLRYSVAGTIVWVSIFTLAGYYFGQIPFIQKNFTALIMGIVAISLAPLAVSFFKQYFSKIH